MKTDEFIRDEFIRQQALMINKLGRMIEGHRKAVVITCPEDCICWWCEEIMIDAQKRLNDLNIAHSVDCNCDECLTSSCSS